MGAVWVAGELTAGGGISRLSTQVATLARGLAGAEVVGVVVSADPSRGARELAEFAPRVIAIADPAATDHAWSTIAAERIAALAAARQPEVILAGADPDGRDLAGVLSVLLDLGVLANATSLSWDNEPTVLMSIFGGRYLTRNAFTHGRGIVTVLHNVVPAEPTAERGTVETVIPTDALRLPLVNVIDRVVVASAGVAVEGASVIVCGGRGVGSLEGFQLVQELADELGGAVGASRPAVDSGWALYSQQIGQTGKIVKPELYLGLGVSGAMQHKAGMQTAGTIVAINSDPDAPIAEFADLLVVGDLRLVGQALLTALRGRADHS